MRADVSIDLHGVSHYFGRFCKPKDQILVGLEAELLGVGANTGKAIPYEGSLGVEGILEELVRRYQWIPILEEGRVIALEKEGAEIHLEPGGQLELSGSPRRSLRENLTEVQDFYQELKEVSAAKGIAWLELGMHPLSSLSEIPWVPKKRYQILNRFLKARGSLSHRMMKQTATLQANLDYANLEEAMKMLRTALGLAPVMVGLFANSPLSEGKNEGWLSLRAQSWLDTDPARCGLIPSLLVDEPRLEDYIQYLLKIPMIFLVREGRWLDCPALPFEDFLKNGYLGYSSTEADWKLFLTSIFTEARLNPFLEVRSSDRNSLPVGMGMVALWKGILLDREARDAAWQLARDWTWSERQAFLRDAARLSFKAAIGEVTLKELAREIISYAKEALKRRWDLGWAAEDESIFLGPVEELIERGVSPAEKLLSLWEGPWNHDPQKLIEYFRI